MSNFLIAQELVRNGTWMQYADTANFCVGSSFCANAELTDLPRYINNASFFFYSAWVTSIMLHDSSIQREWLWFPICEVSPFDVFPQFLWRGWMRRLFLFMVQVPGETCSCNVLPFTRIVSLRVVLTNLLPLPIPVHTPNWSTLAYRFVPSAVPGI